MAQVYFTDISKIGKDFTGTKDISLLTNEQAVLESISNILNTEPGDRVMNPQFGCNLEQFLFDPIDDLTAVYIRKEIYDAIEKYEQRVENLNVVVIGNEDENTYDVTVTFNMKVLNTQQTLNLTLNKIR